MGNDRTMRVAHAPASAASVRHRLRRELAARGVPAGGLDDAALIVSELVSNAVRHGRPLPDGRVIVQWRIEGHTLLLRVTDAGGPTRPKPVSASRDSVGGRGLTIVATLSSAWGVERDAGTSTVWAQVPLRRLHSHRGVAARQT